MRRGQSLGLLLRAARYLHFLRRPSDQQAGGPGIDKQDQERIFEEFQQSDSALTKGKTGTGLGLAIAKRIAELHGGQIRVESTLGEGSTFYLRIPFRGARSEIAP